MLGDQQMAGTGNRQELGNAFNNAEQNDVENIHARLSLLMGQDEKRAILPDPPASMRSDGITARNAPRSGYPVESPAGLRLKALTRHYDESIQRATRF
jgi:hypothetical protein